MCAYMYIIGICHWHVSYVDIVWRCDMEIYVDIIVEISYGDIIRRYHVEISYGDEF